MAHTNANGKVMEVRRVHMRVHANKRKAAAGGGGLHTSRSSAGVHARGLVGLLVAHRGVVADCGGAVGAAGCAGGRCSPAQRKETVNKGQIAIFVVYPRM